MSTIIDKVDDDVMHAFIRLPKDELKVKFTQAFYNYQKSIDKNMFWPHRSTVEIWTIFKDTYNTDEVKKYLQAEKTYAENYEKYKEECRNKYSMYNFNNATSFRLTYLYTRSMYYQSSSSRCDKFPHCKKLEEK